MVSVLHILKSGREIKEIDYLYQPERIGKEEIKKNIEKCDFRYTLSSSNLLAIGMINR